MSYRCVLAFLVGWLAALAPAPAQVAQEAGPLVAPVMRSEMDRYAAMLGLDAGQKASLLELFRGYRVALRDAQKQGNEAVERANKADGKDRSQAKWDAVTAYVAKAETLEKSLFEDAAALAGPAKSAEFQRVERARVREVGLKFSFAAGERLDLVRICEEIGVRRTPELGEVLDEYEQRLDRAIADKRRVFKEIFKKVGEAEVKGDSPDHEVLDSFLKSVAEKSYVIRDVNRETTRRVEGFMSDSDREKFGRLVLQRSFPRVYGVGPVEKMLAAAMKLDSLSAEQRKELESFGEAYARDAVGVNKRLADAVEAKQRTVAEKGEAALMTMDREDVQDPLTMARAERTKLDAGWKERISKTLNESQQKDIAKAAVNEQEGRGSPIEDILFDFETDIRGLEDADGGED
ncbi:MAG: hypothetical protein JSR77_07905 [Planctomycetes bacterium]|nr:hypothetical protein [Planctomycetota bacterium]